MRPLRGVSFFDDPENDPSVGELLVTFRAVALWEVDPEFENDVHHGGFYLSMGKLKLTLSKDSLVIVIAKRIHPSIFVQVLTTKGTGYMSLGALNKFDDLFKEASNNQIQ